MCTYISISTFNKYVYVYSSILYVYIYCILCYTYHRVEEVRTFLRPTERRCNLTLTDSQKKANAKYREKSIKRIPLDVQKEKYEEIKAAADRAGESVNGYIKKAVDQRIEREPKDPVF